MSSSRKRGFSFTAEQLTVVEQKMREVGIKSREALAESAQLSIDVIKKLFRGGSVQRSTVEAIATTLEIQPTDLITLEEWHPLRSKNANSLAPKDHWQQVCRAMLDRQKKLSTNEVIASEAMQFDLLNDEVLVSLALVERKEPDRLSQDVHPERPINRYEEKPPIEYEVFREQVLRQGKSDRIAIVGEPGAGKTTLLQHIAFWILDQKLGLPIWISLGDLIKNGELQRLKDYLTQVWLEDAISNVTEEIRADFLKQLGQQRIWFLLDGADEVVSSSGITLREINNQLRSWLAQSHIVLTCRVNVWDADINALRDFHTYRTKEFHYPTQVEQFIRSGFRKSDELSGERLRTALARPEQTRLQQLACNPLRLMMLCTTWHEHESLPATKAELYKRFVSEFYKWNRTKWKKKDLNYAFFPNTVAQQEKLNQALGRLASRALDEEASPFRLSYELVFSELGDPDEDGSDFWLALNLGWLQVARDSDKFSEKVYTFFHPTFQEYFAALAIDDWHYFFTHTPAHPIEGRYRVLEAHWKEVFLIWMGRLNIQEERKEEFITSLLEFGHDCKDCYGGFYHYQAFFLAAAALGELSLSLPLTCKVAEQLVELAFGYFEFETQVWVSFPAVISSRAKEALRETNRIVIVDILVQLMEQVQESKVLGSTQNKQMVLTKEIKLICSSEIELGIINLAKLLTEVDPGNQTAIAALDNLLNQAGLISEIAAAHLSEISPNNVRAKTIHDSTMTIFNKSNLKPIVKALEHIASKKRIINEETKDASIESYIQALHQSYESRDLACIAAIERLGEIGIGNIEVMEVLVTYLLSESDLYICRTIYLSLEKVITPTLFSPLIKTLKNYLASEVRSKNFSTREYSLSLLWYCAQSMSFQSFYQLWYLPCK